MTHDFSYDVFLSHNAKDKPRVRRLAERLRQAGLRVWFDEWNVRSGDIIALKVDEGLEQSRVLLLCISPNALTSGWVALERSTAIHRDPSNEGRRFIPLLLADCELPDTLRRYKYVDFREEAEAAFAELLTACRLEAVELPPADNRAPKNDLTKKKLKPIKLPTPSELMAVLERKLTGHTDWVKSVAVSPDGKWAASGSDDKTVKIWDLETGQCRATLLGHSDCVNSVAITPDSSRILSGSSDKSIRVWDASKATALGTFELTRQILGVKVLADGRRVLTCSSNEGEDGELMLWDIESQDRLWIARGRQTDHIRSIAVAPDGTRAVSGSYKTVRIWDLEAGECVATLKGHSTFVTSVEITKDGQFAVSGSEDTTVRIWDLGTGVCVGKLEGHQSAVASVAVSPDSALIASAGPVEEVVRLCSFISGASLLTIEFDEFPSPRSIVFTPDGSRLVVGTQDGPIYVYLLTSVRPAPSGDAARRYVNAKVVLLGEGTVGKTSLAHRLIEDKYVVRDRTHGMNVWRLDLPLPPDATLEREALLWDLAGQEDYRLIHQLFLEETALAHPPDGRDERRPDHPLDERDALSQGTSRQDKPPDPLRRREARHGSGVEGARSVFPTQGAETKIGNFPFTRRRR